MSSIDRHSDACERTLVRLDQYLSGELDAPTEATVSAHIASCASCANELVQMRSVRDALRAADRSVVAPQGLAQAIRASHASEPHASSSTTLPRAPVPRASLWTYAIAALLCLSLGASLFLRNDEQRPTFAGGPQSTQQQVESMLQVGLTDHVECAVRYRYADEEYSHEKVLAKLDDDYDGLADVVRRHAPVYRLTLGHHCSFAGHDFVHLILKNDSAVISLAITERNTDESFPDAATDNDDLAVFHSGLQGYEVAGFETGRFVVYTISDMTSDSHVRLTMALSYPVAEFLATVRA